MLAVTHLVAGAAVGAALRRPAPGALAGLASHALLDGVGHDDDAIPVWGQAVLAGAGLAALVAAWGPWSSAVLGGLAGLVPDVEIAADRVLLRGGMRHYAFPSHWQLPGRSTAKAHPYRFPGPAVPVALEVGVTLAALAALCAGGARRRRPG